MQADKKRKQNVKCIAGTWSYISFQDNWSRQCQRIPFWKRRTFQVSTSSAISDLTLSMIIIYHVSGHSRRHWTPSETQGMQQHFKYLRGGGGLQKDIICSDLCLRSITPEELRNFEELHRGDPNKVFYHFRWRFEERFSHRVQWAMSGWRTQACPLAGRSRRGSTVLTISGGHWQDINCL